MNPSPSQCTRIENTGSRWSWLVNIGRSLMRPSVPTLINTGDYSEHMLRDIGMMDGRPIRGEASAAVDDLQKEILRRSV